MCCFKSRYDISISTRIGVSASSEDDVLLTGGYGRASFKSAEKVVISRYPACVVSVPGCDVAGISYLQHWQAADAV